MNRTDGLWPLSHLTLQPGEERLEIRYTSAHFAAPEHVRFRHRLVGLDSHWIEVVGALDEVVWAVDPGNDTLDNLATYLCQYAEEFLAETDLRLRLNVPPVLPDIPLSSAVRHNVFLVVKEALNNAVKHSGASTVLFSLSHDTGSVEICVEDDGIGFDPPAVKRGSGLNNMAKRIDELRGSICFERRPGKGCRVVCRIPVV